MKFAVVGSSRQSQLLARLAESSGVNVSVGWGKALSDPAGRQANRQAVADSESVKPPKSFPIGSG